MTRIKIPPPMPLKSAKAQEKSEALEKGAGLERALQINAPNMRIAEFSIVGTAPYVQHRFSQKTLGGIIDTQKAGSVAQGKKIRKPKDFEQNYRDAMYISRTGARCGIPASAFRNAAISACRTVGFKMTHAKLGLFVLPDGFDKLDGTPMVYIDGKPKMHLAAARNDNGSVDVRARPMFEEWGAKVRVRFDADMFHEKDIANLFMRIGLQVGIGEGRADSKNSAGVGWGHFRFADKNERIGAKKRSAK